nr:cytochrome c [Kyrpidia tusciae]
MKRWQGMTLAALPVVLGLVFIIGVFANWFPIQTGRSTEATASGSESGGGSGPVDTSDPGAQIFSQSCASCHGANLEGQTGPKLLGIGGKMNEAQLVEYINNPKPVAGYPSIMPPKGGLQSEDEVKQVAAWLAKQK